MPSKAISASFIISEARDLASFAKPILIFPKSDFVLNKPLVFLSIYLSDALYISSKAVFISLMEDLSAESSDTFLMA